MKRYLPVLLVIALAASMVVPAVAYARMGKAPDRPTFVSRPFTKHVVNKVGTDFAAWGYVKTHKAKPLTTGAAATIYVWKWTRVKSPKVHYSWESSAGLTTAAVLSTTTPTPHCRTKYATKMNIGAKGLYKLRTKLVWVDAKSITRTLWSPPSIIGVR